jgi:hypothetical protein
MYSNERLLIGDKEASSEEEKKRSIQSQYKQPCETTDGVRIFPWAWKNPPAAGLSFESYPLHKNDALALVQ